jgi:hypothetical protein
MTHREYIAIGAHGQLWLVAIVRDGVAVNDTLASFHHKADADTRAGRLQLAHRLPIAETVFRSE